MTTAVAPASAVQTIGEPGVRALYYYNVEAGRYDPVPNAQIYYEEYDPYENRTYGAGQIATGPDGTYVTPCPTSGSSYSNYLQGSIRYETLDVTVWKSGASYPGSISEDAYGCTQPADGFGIMDSEWSQVFVNMQQYVAASHAFFGHSRQALDVMLDAGASISAYYHAQPWGPTGYDDHIVIASAGQNSAVWYDYGHFTQAHEYGHAMHDRAFGGIYKQQNCTSDGHSIDLPNTFGCAWAEGVADYHGAAIMDASAPFTYANLVATNQYYANSSANSDGSVWENAVAAFLYDLTDTAGDEPFDHAQVSGYFLGEAISQCRVSGQNGVTHANGIDDIVYCLEQSVDAQVRASYFPQRIYKPSGITATNGSSPGLTQSVVRELWLKDLYRQTYTPPPPPPPLSSVSLDGPDQVQPFSNSCSWTAVTSGGAGGLRYEWTADGSVISTDGPMIYAGNSGSNFMLGVTVFDDAAGVQLSTSKVVIVTDGADYCAY